MIVIHWPAGKVQNVRSDNPVINEDIISKNFHPNVSTKYEATKIPPTGIKERTIMRT